MNKLEQAARQAFETWWEREGQEFLYALNTTTDDDIKLVAEIAWKNGAYCAEQAEQEPVAFKFVRYVDGKEMAEGVTIEREKTLEAAIKKAVAICPNRNKTVLVYAAPVRTKDHCNPLQDLTDDEIEAIHGCPPAEWVRRFARAVIAADREKNK